jgi:glycine dehydrogenase subunit 2
MSINQSGWRPTSPEANTGGVPASVTGNKALMLEEALIFEIGDTHTTGVDFAAPSPLRGEGRGRAPPPRPAMLRPEQPLTQPSPRRGEG